MRKDSALAEEFRDVPGCDVATNGYNRRPIEKRTVPRRVKLSSRKESHEKVAI